MNTYEFWTFITIFAALGLFVICLVILIRMIEKMNNEMEAIKKDHVRVVKLKKDLADLKSDHEKVRNSVNNIFRNYIDGRYSYVHRHDDIFKKAVAQIKSDNDDKSQE